MKTSVTPKLSRSERARLILDQAMKEPGVAAFVETYKAWAEYEDPVNAYRRATAARPERVWSNSTEPMAY